MLRFDPRSSTENSHNYLQVNDVAGNPISPLLCGGGGAGRQRTFPNYPVVINGDTLELVYHTNAFAFNWGYRVIAKGVMMKAPTAFPVLYDMEKTIGCVYRKYIANLLKGSPGACNHHHRIISSLLFSYNRFSYYRFSSIIITSSLITTFLITASLLL